MSVTFAHGPLALVLAPLALLALARALAVARARGALRSTRARLAALLQGALLLTLLLALAAPRVRGLGGAPRGTSVLLLFDRSRSTERVPAVGERYAALLREAAGAMGPDDRLGVFAFARAPEVTHELAPAALARTFAPPPAPLDRDGSDLASALAHALAALPDERGPARVVLVSDGDATQGDALAAALGCAAARVPVDVVPLARSVERDVRAVRLRGPDRAAQGEPLELELVTQSDAPTRARIELLRDGVVLDRVEHTLARGVDAVPLRARPEQPGLARYEARVLALDARDDAVAGDETAAAYVRVEGPGRALVLTGAEAGASGAVLREALSRAGLEVTVREAARAPEGAAALAAYDLVVLSDARALELPVGAEEALRDAVRSLGVGLWMLGSEGAFGPGGYASSPLAEVLPVRVDLRRERERATVALAIAIDRSGSMGAPVPGGRTKLDLANEGAARSATMLGPVDRVGILHVDTQVSWTLPMQPAQEPRALEEAARAATVGGGGIYTDVALRAAYGALRGEATTLRHVLLLADGGDAEQLAPCHELTRAARAAHVTTSVVAIGAGNDVPGLAQLAREGGGRFYLATDARTLPRIFAEDTALSARSPLREEPVRPRVVSAAEVLAGIDFAQAPALAGYVVTEARPRSEVLLRALDDEPLLARWQDGLGRVAAFTSDLGGRWSRGWLAWPGASALAGQLGAWLARSAQGSQGATRVSARAEGGQLVVEAELSSDDGALEASEELVARVVSASLDEAGQGVLEARGAGRYGVALPAPRAGTYVVAVARRDGALLGYTGLDVAASEELRGGSGDRALLEELARRSGGRVRDAGLGGVFRDGAPARGEAERELTRALVYAALALLVLTVAARRMPLPPVRAWLRAALPRAPREGAEASAPSADEGALVVLRALRARHGERTADERATGERAAGERAAGERAAGEVAGERAAVSERAASVRPAGGLDELVERRRQRRR